jgi:hypothetical protein
VLFVWVTGETPLRCSFEDYKKNEKKEVKVDEILGADVARKAVSDAMVSTCSMCLMCMKSVHTAAPGQADIHRNAPTLIVCVCACRKCTMMSTCRGEHGSA